MSDNISPDEVEEITCDTVLDTDEEKCFGEYIKAFLEFEEVSARWSGFQLLRYPTIFQFMDKKNRKDINILIEERLPENRLYSFPDPDKWYKEYKRKKIDYFPYEKHREINQYREINVNRLNAINRIFYSMAMIYGPTANQAYEALMSKQKDAKKAEAEKVKKARIEKVKEKAGDTSAEKTVETPVDQNPETQVEPSTDGVTGGRVLRTRKLKPVYDDEAKEADDEDEEEDINETSSLVKFTDQEKELLEIAKEYAVQKLIRLKEEGTDFSCVQIQCPFKVRKRIVTTRMWSQDPEPFDDIAEDDDS